MSKYHTECTHAEHKKKEVPPATVTIAPEPEKPKDDGADLLAVLNPNRACSCDVVARAVRADVPRYLGLSVRRASLEKKLESEFDIDPDLDEPKTPGTPKNAPCLKKSDILKDPKSQPPFK